ncbi:unnamed protein product, partial [Pelagomonas calceolata]
AAAAAAAAAAATPLRVRVRSRRAGVRRRLHLTGQARFFAVVIHGCGRVAPPVRIGARELAAELVRGRGRRAQLSSMLREAFVPLALRHAESYPRADARSAASLANAALTPWCQHQS